MSIVSHQKLYSPNTMNQKNLSAERKTENLKFYSQKNVFKIKEREFPGGPMVRTPHFHCRGHGFNP